MSFPQGIVIINRNQISPTLEQPYLMVAHPPLTFTFILSLLSWPKGCTIYLILYSL